jgi:hypothetical protein
MIIRYGGQIYDYILYLYANGPLYKDYTLLVIKTKTGGYITGYDNVGHVIKLNDINYIEWSKDCLTIIEPEAKDYFDRVIRLKAFI